MVWAYYAIIFLFGAAMGSFLNAYLWRVRQGKSVWKGRSMCTECNATIKWYDNIPVASFFVLHGKCRACKKPISFHYPVVEAWMGFAFLAIAQHYSLLITHYSFILRDWFIVFVLTMIFLYDFHYREILDRMSLLPAGLLFVLSIIFEWRTWDSMLLAAAVAGGFFFLQFVFSKGKWIGGGDIRLGVLMGVVLGWPNILAALMIAYVLGAIVGLALVALRRVQMSSEVPFGTFLTAATVVAMFFGDAIVGWYVGFVM